MYYNNTDNQRYSGILKFALINKPHFILFSILHHMLATLCCLPPLKSGILKICLEIRLCG